VPSRPLGFSEVGPTFQTSGLPRVVEGLSPGYGRIAGLNRVGAGAYLSDVRAATNFRGAEKSRVWVGGDILWPDGETEAVKGFITEHDAAKWIAEHSQANVLAARYRQGSN
jgi:hypothetical protein